MFYTTRIVTFVIFLIALLVEFIITDNNRSFASDDIIMSQSEMGLTPLMNAAAEGNDEAISVFINTGSNVNKKNLGGATALHLAVRNNHIDTVNELIKNGADVNIKDNKGWTPLMRASMNGNPEIGQLLIISGAKLWEVNNWDESALMHASMADCIECVNNILYEARMRGIVGEERRVKKQISSAIEIAKQKNNKKIQEALENNLEEINFGSFKKAVSPAEETGPVQEKYKFTGESTSAKKGVPEEMGGDDYEPATRLEDLNVEKGAIPLEEETKLEKDVTTDKEDVLYKLKKDKEQISSDCYKDGVEDIEKAKTVEEKKATDELDYKFKEKTSPATVVPETEKAEEVLEEEKHYQLKEEKKGVINEEEGVDTEAIETKEGQTIYKLRKGKEKNSAPVPESYKKQNITPREEEKIVKDSWGFIY